MKTKLCTGCRKELPETEFHKNRALKSGLLSQCKACKRKYRTSSHGIAVAKRAAERAKDSVPRKIAQLYADTKKRAKQLCLPHTLTVEWIRQRVERGTCSVTGRSFDLSFANASKTRRRPNAPSVDRIDTKKGYVPSNCRVVIAHFNLARADFGDDAFESLARDFLRTISSRALPKGIEGSTTIPKGSRGKRLEAPNTLLH